MATDIQLVDLKRYLDAIETARVRGLVVIRAERAGDMVHLETGTPDERAAQARAGGE